MKIQALEYFVTMAETGSINEAARRLYVSQPSLTKSLAALEDELNVKLFNRSKSGLILTEEGKKILPEAKTVLSLYRGWKSLSASFPSKGVRIAEHISLAGFLVPDIVIRFRSRYPELNIRGYTTPEPEALFSNDSTKAIISICIFSDESAREYSSRPDTVVQKLCSGYYGCLIRKDDPLAQHSELSFADVKERYLILNNILPDASDNISELGDHYCSFIDNFLSALTGTITPSRVIQIDTVNSVINHVAEQPGTFAISFAPAHRRYPHVKNGTLVNIPFVEPSTKGSLCLVYSGQAYKKYPVIKELIDELSGYFALFENDSRT